MQVKINWIIIFNNTNTAYNWTETDKKLCKHYHDLFDLHIGHYWSVLWILQQFICFNYKHSQSSHTTWPYEIYLGKNLTVPSCKKSQLLFSSNQGHFSYNEWNIMVEEIHFFTNMSCFKKWYLPILWDDKHRGTTLAVLSLNFYSKNGNFVKNNFFGI